MSDPFDDAILQSYSRAAGGEDMDLVVGEDGLTTYALPEPEVQPEPMPADFAGVEDQTDPFAIAGEVEPMSVGEFAEKTGEMAAGSVGGASAVTLGLPGDLIGIGEGIWASMNAEEGKKLDAFLNKLSRRSQTIGSEKFISEYESFIDSLDLSDEAKQNALAGSKYLGEWAELPGGITAATALLKGAKKTAKATGATGAVMSPAIEDEAAE